MFNLFETKDKKKPNEAELLQKKNEELNIRLEVIAEVNRVMAGVIDKQEVFDLITRKLASSVKMKFPSIWLFNEKESTINLISHSIPDSLRIIAEKAIGKPIEEISFSLKNPKERKSTYFKVLETGKPIFSEDLYSHTYPFLNDKVAKVLSTLSGMKLAVSVPITVKDKAIGVLSAIWQEKELSKENELTLFTFANQISTAIYNSQLFQQVQNQVDALTQQNHDLASLFNLTSQVSRSLDPDVVAQTAVNSLPQDETMAGAIVSFYDEKQKHLYPQAISQNRISDAVTKVIGDFKKYSLDFTEPNAPSSLYYQAVNEERPKFSDNLETVLNPPVPKKFIKPIQNIAGLSSVAVYPMFIRGKLVGTVSYFMKSKKAADFDENQQRLFETYTTQIAIALENAQLFTTSEQVKRSLEQALADLKEARRREQDMLDIMGHELRTPMTIIRNTFSTMELYIKTKGQVPVEKLEKYIDVGIENANRESKLIETMLSATKADSKGFDLTFEKVDLVDVANDAMLGVQTLAKEKGLQVTLEKPEDNVFVYCDRTRVQEIADNFVSNAVKYTNEGYVKLKLWKEGNYGYLAVQDSGIGIGQEDLENLGKKFYRAKQHMEDRKIGDVSVIRPGGTGLGLYVSFSLVKLMDGDYKVESELGKGSKFTFSMPIFKKQEVMQVQRKIDDYLRREDA